ncbi:homospermidine synthase [Azospirillum fermentarium]|uniref:homospermidine synthase n=1 Tax=Azospirillum fermentarium TaxID=1233114 RepID=UPI002225D315|nr:saccharopine dehydrogenase C-terminal domain-containing protein [Azospirillum fermentarium]MCW2247489.1 homospermidine synthase [Azospirillum fermentarium]
MSLDITHFTFTGRIVMIGCGSIGQGVLPLLFRHLAIKPEQVTIVTADERGRAEADAYKVKFIKLPLTPDNFRHVLTPMLSKGDFLVNVSVDVSSTALIELCQERGAFYTDTCIEPWVGGYTDPTLSPSLRSNYALRETALACKEHYEGGPTAVITHGANPGLVSHFVKRALLNLARDNGLAVDVPTTRNGWGTLAQRLGIKAIHIAERDTQASNIPKKQGEFVNTWSIDGFISEGCQPAELGWGTHEKALPPDGRRHDFGCDAAIYLMRPGATTRVRTWTPQEGPFHGFLITHSEAISIADYFTVREGGHVTYRPTVHYAYHPCDDAVTSLHELAGKNWYAQESQRLMMGEIVSGCDELGVLLMGNEKGVYWYGSRLSIDQARTLAPNNNATSLQVTPTLLAGMIWALENPNRGVVEPDEIDFARILDIAVPYLGDMVGEYGDWTPLQDRNRLFPEDVDADDPWQFKNVRVS